MFFDFGHLADLGAFGILLVLLLLVWSIVWKGIALWVTAKENHKPWFIMFLVLNTFGILEIIYLFCFSKRGAEFISGLKKRRAYTSER